MKIGIHLGSLRMPFKKALHTAAALGADAVEIDARGEIRPRELTRTGLRQLRKMLDDLNLRVCAVTYRTRRGYHVAEHLDRRVEGTKEALRFAFDLGAAVVVNQVGPVPVETEGQEWQLLQHALSEIGAYGLRVGAVLAAEAGYEDGSQLARLLQALPAGSLGVTFDPGNCVIQGFSASAALASLAEYVVHVHARDGARDLARGRGLETPLGRGSVDFAELVGVLEENDYRGYFSIERSESNDVVHDIGQAVKYLRSLG